MEDDRKSGADASLGRRFFLALGGLTLGAWALLGGWMVIRFLGFRRPRGRPSRFVAGSSTDFPKGALHLREEVWIGRDKGGLYGLVNRCPHLGCHPRWEPERKVLACPCHGSLFDLHGRVLRGPANRPLTRAHLSWGANQEVVVNLGIPVGEDFRLK